MESRCSGDMQSPKTEQLKTTSAIEGSRAVKGEESEEWKMECKYWVAVNGGSAAACGCPLPVYPTVVPTPQALIGFDTQEEQLRCQRFLLAGRLDKVRRYVTVTLPKLAAEGKVLLKKFNCPEKPTRGQTVWSYEGGAE